MEFIANPITASSALIAASALIWYLTSKPGTDIPLLADHLWKPSRIMKYVYDAKSLIAESKEKKLPVCKITTLDGEIVYLSQDHIDELKELSDDDLDIFAGIRNLLCGDYTYKVDPHPLTVHVVKMDLTPNLGKLMPAISEEIDDALMKNMPNCDDWEAVNLHDVLLNVVAQVSARVFVGAPLCRDQRWIDLTRNYTLKVLQATKAIKPVPHFLRPIVAPYLPQLAELDRVRQEAIAFMSPIAQQRQEDDESREDFTAWMKKRATPGWGENYAQQAEVHVNLALMAIHTTTITTTQILNDLLEHPHYIDILRDELRDVLAQTGGQFTKDTMSKLRKLDSFMRESQRHNGLGLTTFKRKVLRDITLSDGTFIPAGTFLEVPIDERFDKSLNFDGLRSYKIRENSAKEGLAELFTTANSNNLNWGAGRHACPGRFFASNEIKSIVAKILINYELRRPHDKTTEPLYMNFGTSIMPNPAIRVMFKKLEVQPSSSS